MHIISPLGFVCFFGVCSTMTYAFGGLQLVLTCLSNKTNIGINVLHALASKIKVSCWIYQIEYFSRCIAECIAVHRGILEKRYGWRVIN